MPTSYKATYDVGIQGSNLAASLVALDLAKLGWNVLFLEPPSLAHPFLARSPLSETALGKHGLSVPTRPAEPVQVLCGTTRVDLHCGRPLMAELQRELPDDAEILYQTLVLWQQQGRRLEQALVERPLVGTSLAKSVGFAWHARKSLNYSILKQPLAALWPADLTDEGNLFLRTLLEGMACSTLNGMTVAEAFLLVDLLLNPTNIDVTELHRSAFRLFEPLSIDRAPLHSVHQLSWRNKELELSFTDGASTRLHRFISSGATPFKELKQPRTAPAFVRQKSTPLGHPLPPTYAQRILLGGEPTARLLLTARSDQAEILAFTPEPAENLNQRVEQLFPFSTCSFQKPSPVTPSPCQQRGLFYQVNSRTKLRKKVWRCAPSILFPHLHGVADLLTLPLLLQKIKPRES